MKADRATWTRLRLTLVFGIFALVWVIILWRTFQLQVVQRDRLAGIADRENHKIVKLNPVRGEIYDRNGEKLAVSLETDSVFAEPTKLEDPEAAARDLAKILGLDRRRLTEKLKNNDTFTWVERQIDPEKREKIETLKIKGIGFVKESKRFYPNNLLAAHVLGFAGVDSRGLEGLEMGCDKYLMGDANEWRVKRDALGRTYLDRDTLGPRPGQGKNLTLTLDRRIQYITEKALAKAVEEYGAKGGLALVVRPNTGEILASAVYPGFNPNVFGRYDRSQRRNRVLTDAFDPGSTFKIFVVAGALEDGVVRPEDMIDCEKGAYAIGRRTIHDHHPYAWLKVSDVIKRSSNIGAAKIGDQLGPAQLYHYLTRFNFGEKTGIDFPGESSGLLRSYKKWRPIDAANGGFWAGCGRDRHPTGYGRVRPGQRWRPDAPLPYLAYHRQLRTPGDKKPAGNCSPGNFTGHGQGNAGHVAASGPRGRHRHPGRLTGVPGRRQNRHLPRKWTR